jgi:hypothetical protein
MSEIKYCQSCIERGFNPPNIASREWTKGVFYCEECFAPLINNMLDIGNHESIKEVAEKVPVNAGPILTKVYEVLNVPPELQFQKVDDVCRNYDKLFNYHAPAIVNRDLESLTRELEELQMAIFQIKFYSEPLDGQIKLLKAQRREEKNLKSYDDSKEEYKKPKGTSKLKETQVQKLAKAVSNSGATMSMEEMIKKAREREFHTLSGNCPDCGGKMPCLEHSK